MKASELLRESHGLIRKHGWLQGAYGNLERGFCADGAMLWADEHQEARLPHTLIDARYYFLKVIGVEPRLSVNIQIQKWNDYKGRTKPEVLASFKKAIKLAESEGQ